MRRTAFTLAALALVASCFTLRTTGAFAAHGAGAHGARAGASSTNKGGATGTSSASHANSMFTATTYTVSTLVDGSFQHTYTLATNPFCSGTLSGTGATPSDSGYYTTEGITGSFSPTSVSFTATYNGPYNAGYWYSVSTTNVAPAGGNTYSFSGFITGTSVPVTGTVTMSSTTYQNTGSYVRTLSPTQKAAFESACGTTTSTEGDDQDTDEGSTSGDDQDTDSDESGNTESD